MSDNDRFADMKAFVFIGAGEVFALMAAINVISVHVGHRIIPHGSVFIPLCVAAIPVILNGRLFLSKKLQTEYAREFRKYSVYARIGGGVATLILLIGGVIAFGASVEALKHLPP